MMVGKEVGVEYPIPIGAEPVTSYCRVELDQSSNGGCWAVGQGPHLWHLTSAIIHLTAISENPSQQKQTQFCTKQCAGL